MGIWDIIVKPVTDIINKVVPDTAARDAAKAALEQMRESDAAKQVEDDIKIQLAGLDNVKAEAQGQSWLQRNWRPISALAFLVCIMAFWFGLTPPTLTAEAVTEMFGLLKICLGGYTIGRSVEKVAPTVAAIFKK